MKTFASLSLALMFWLLPASRSSAAAISWGFSGVITSSENPSNALPANIPDGTPFTGYVSYDSVPATGDITPGPQGGAYYFDSDTAFKITVHVAGMTFTCTNRNPGSIFAGIGVSDNVDNRFDELWLYGAGGPPLLNGGPVSASAAQGSIDVSLRDYTQTAVTSDAFPGLAPNFPAYQTGTLSISAQASGSGKTIFYIGGEITEISPLPKVILTATPLAGSQLRLSWPKASSGLTLQFASSLAAQNWTTEPTAVVDTATEHTVTVSTVGQPKFFRLVRLP